MRDKVQREMVPSLVYVLKVSSALLTADGEKYSQHFLSPRLQILHLNT